MQAFGHRLIVDSHQGNNALAVLHRRNLMKHNRVNDMKIGHATQHFGGPRRCDHRAYRGFRLDGFEQQMKPLSDGEAVIGAAAALYRFADALQERMVNAEHSYRLLSIARRKHSSGFLRRVALAAGLCLLLWLAWLALRIHAQSTIDEAQAADVIVVMGAAEYRGKPSPVLKARLDHALALFQRKLAPRIITTGGAGGDPVFTEGAVGRNYFISRGVPGEAIILEAEGETTVHSTVAVAEIMTRMGLTSCILVSDGYHIFRAKKMLEARGLRVYGSPRAIKPETAWRDWWLYTRQAVGFTLWQLGVPI